MVSQRQKLPQESQVPQQIEKDCVNFQLLKVETVKIYLSQKVFSAFVLSHKIIECCLYQQPNVSSRSTKKVLRKRLQSLQTLNKYFSNVRKGKKNDKSNQQPVRLLLILSKVYEKCLQKQLEICIENILSNFQCGFKKGFNAQQCLIDIIKKV